MYRCRLLQQKIRSFEERIRKILVAWSLAVAPEVAIAIVTRRSLLESTSAATAATTTVARPFWPWRSFPYLELSTQQICAVQAFNCCSGFVVVGHCHESEAARATCIAIKYDFYGFYFSVLLKCLRNIAIRGVERQIAYIYIHITDF